MFQKFGKSIPQSLVDMVSGIMEAKVEPDAPDADAIARKKRLQAIKDKQEDDAAERGAGEKKPSGTRTVAGTSYGGAKQKDEPMEEEDLARVRSLIQARKKQYQESEEFELHLDLTEGIESFGLKASDEQKKKAKETGEKFVAAALAKREKTKKESMMGAASSNLTGMGESRGHKIIADKLKQIDELSSKKYAGYVAKRASQVQKSGRTAKDLVHSHDPEDEKQTKAVSHAMGKIKDRGDYGTYVKQVTKRVGVDAIKSKLGIKDKPEKRLGEEADLEESRGHKIIADKLKQIDRMSSGVAPDHSINVQSTKDKLKDAANLKQVEIVKQKDTSVKEESLIEISKKVLGSYIQKASSPTGEKSNVNLASRAAAKLADDGEDDGEKVDRKAYHRSIGIGRAAGKLAKEATDTETKDASGKVTSWQHTGDWKKSAPGHTGTKTGKGKVAHLSDFARKKTTQMASEESVSEESLDEISADLVGRYSDKANKEYNDPKTSEHKKATRRAGLMLGYNKAKGRANVPATYKEEADEFTHGRETLSYGTGIHPNVAKELHKHAGKIEAMFHNTKDNALAAVVHNSEIGRAHV